MQRSFRYVGAAMALAIAALGIGPAAAQTAGLSQQGVLVELFTSQGCSSCPPADALLQQLTRADGVIPLALHVDYWDYIGWRDTFAQDQFTKRQRRYAAVASAPMVYTPQMIIAGGARIKGYDAREVRDEIRAAQSLADLTLLRQGDEVMITATPKAGLTGAFVVDMVRYRPQSIVAIQRGENQGLEMAYHNIVTQWQTLGEWSGQGDLSLRARAAGSEPIVVIIQSIGPREVIAAAVLK